jgi:hypothetical protein
MIMSAIDAHIIATHVMEIQSMTALHVMVLISYVQTVIALTRMSAVKMTVLTAPIQTNAMSVNMDTFLTLMGIVMNVHLTVIVAPIHLMMMI